MLSQPKNKLFYNFFSLGAVQAISSLIQLIVIPHVILQIGVDGYGVVAVAQVMMFYLSVLTDYSFNQTATRDIALHRADPVTVSRIFSRVFIARLILCLVAFLLLLILVWVVPLFRSHLFLYCMAFTFVAGQSLLINWFFLGLEKMHYITLVTLIARVLFAVLVFVFINDRSDGYLFLFFLGTGNIIAGLLSLIIAFRIYQLRFIGPGIGTIMAELKQGWQITISHILNSSCNYSNIFILRFFAGDLVVGYYGIAERIYFTIKQVYVVFSQAIYPQVCQLVQQGKESAVHFLRKTYGSFLLMVITGCLILFIFSPEVLYFFTGNGYQQAVYYLRAFSIIAVIVCLNIPGTLVLLALDQKRPYLKVYALAMVLNISLNIILARLYQANGTIVAIFVTEFFIAMGLTRMVYRTGQVKQRWVSDPPDNMGY